MEQQQQQQSLHHRKYTVHPPRSSPGPYKRGATSGNPGTSPLPQSLVEAPGFSQAVTLLYGPGGAPYRKDGQAKQ